MSAAPRPAVRRPINPVRRPGAPVGMRRPQQTSSSGPGAISRGGTAPGSKGNDDSYLYVAGVKDPSKRVTEYRVGGR